ncbi:hypothetical protein PR202_gb19015 [Eleusine coracana subsp. coracana]|uniref:Uncharacterized protein n=1 Tax=Eleusine coracana subsp. coracana TaxID=191504 RepID=A0AAV5F743_ELECO|nr:hypothetical protein PR202_gb19015 [Eleusine coracana subsp. coracana]
MERSRLGLLVSMLEDLEELGLDVLDADDTPFRLQVLSGSGSGFSPKANGSRLVARPSASNTTPFVHGATWRVLDKGRTLEQHPPEELSPRRR